MSRVLQNLIVMLLAVLVCACTSLPTVTPVPKQYVVEGTESRTLQTADNLTLFGQWWHPSGGKPPRGAVLLVHGTLVHSGFYAPWAKELARNGYAVFGIDLRGWGQSQGHGRRGFVRDYNEYVADVRLAWAEMRQRYPDTPIFLQGESLGGGVVLLAQQQGAFDAKGLILNAPAIKPNPGIGIFRGSRAAFWLASLPGHMLPNAPALPAKVVESGISLILRDEEGQKHFKNDPHSTHTALPYAYVTALYEATGRIKGNLAQIDEPLIILHGTSDVLVPHTSSRWAMRKVASKDKTLKVYEGMTHATLHDSDKRMVWLDILNWLDARTTEPKEAPVVKSTVKPEQSALAEEIL